MNPNETLSEFCKSINQWIENGCSPNNQYNFSKHTGICSNLNSYLSAEKCDHNTKVAMTHILMQSFANEKLGRIFPFNKNPYEYYEEIYENKIYANPLRLQWIKSNILQP